MGLCDDSIAFPDIGKLFPAASKQTSTRMSLLRPPCPQSSRSVSPDEGLYWIGA